METQEIKNAHSKFMATKYWPELDGLRAFSILLVLISHMRDPEWSFISGALGVTLFFVISGFLITTLLLREEKASGRVSLPNFYVRRSFRIVPLYALALLIYSILVLALRLGSGGENYLERLPLLATFNGEFAGSGTFGHSWSLGIEEKFYLIWPLLAFGVAVVSRWRGHILVLLVPLTAIASFVPGIGYAGIYFPILGGCALAILANKSSTFKYVNALSRPVMSLPILACMLVLLFTDQYLPITETSGYSHTVFAISVVLAMPSILFSRMGVNRLFAHPFLAFIGSRSYAIYLFHPICLHLVDKVMPPASGSLVLIVMRFVLVCTLSFATAELLNRTIEGPLIRLGRNVIAKRSVRKSGAVV